MLDLKQKELHEWQKQNFGEHSDDILRVTIGMSEEVGEICHHILKGTQGIREGFLGIHSGEVADGIADTLIYGVQLMSLLNLNAETEIQKVINQVLKRNWKKDRIKGGDK